MKKILKGIGIILLLIAISVAFFIYNTLSQYKKLKQGELNENFICDTIPFTYSNTGHITLGVKINDSSDEYPFFLDSGAGNMIFKSFTKNQNFEGNGFGISMGAKRNIFFSKIRKISSIQIGNAVISNVNAKETDFNFDCSEDICGIIGTGIMKNFVWVIDFQKQIIIISRQLDKNNLNGNEIEIPLSENKFSHHISTNIKFQKDKKTKRVLIDLGNNSALSLKEDLILKDSLSFKQKNIIGLGSKGLGQVDDNIRSKDKYYLSDNLIFSNSSYFVNDIPISASPNNLNLLGLGFFNKYKTILSWADKKLILIPNESTLNFVWKTYGFSTRYNKELNKVEIASITENTSASRAGIQLFSELVSVNSKTFLDSLSYCEYKGIRNWGDTIVLGIRENDSIKTYKLAKELLFE